MIKQDESLVSESAASYAINQFQENYEKVMKNRETMRQGAEAARHFAKLGLIGLSEEEKQARRRKEMQYGKRYRLPKKKKLEIVNKIDALRKQGMSAREASLKFDLKEVTYRYWRRTLKGGKFDG